MKKINISINILKNLLHIVTVLFILIGALQQNQKMDKVQLSKENIENKLIANTIETSNVVTKRKRENLEVTTRTSTIRSAKVNMQEEIQYTKIEDVTISKDMDLTIRTGISKEDFKKWIANVKYDKSKFFYENSDLIYDLCEKYQINEIFFCGLISAESGWDIASNHRRTYNYISLMSKGKLIQYSSLEEGLEIAAKKLHNNYLTEGGCFYNGKTLKGVKVKFCPASSTWTNLVYGRMQQIMNCK